MALKRKVRYHVKNRHDDRIRFTSRFGRVAEIVAWYYRYQDEDVYIHEVTEVWL